MIVPGATAPPGLVALIGVTAIGYAEGEENSDEFQQYPAEGAWSRGGVIHRPGSLCPSGPGTR
jgi:hypothetical protein